MEKNIAELQTRLQFLESLYRARSEDILKIKNKIFKNNISYTITKMNSTKDKFTPEIVMMLKNMTGMKASKGVQTKALSTMENSFIYKLLPHLMEDPNSLRPSYHLRSNRQHSEIVIGIPTVKRDKESYLIVTLTHLIDELNEKDKKDTLILILIGETDLEYVLSVAKQIETE
ncbi:unnamed protein product [Euphydryas editha]|nr:unnamed protein product [Euphydryas editha]